MIDCPACAVSAQALERARAAEINAAMQAELDGPPMGMAAEEEPVGYKLQYTFTWVFFVGSLVLAAIQVQAEPLELTAAQRALIAILQALCTGVLPFLPKLQKPPDDARVGMD